MTDRLEEFLRSQMQQQTATIRAGEDVWTRVIDRGKRLRRRRRGTALLGVGAIAALVIAAGSLAGRLGEDRPDRVGPAVVESPSADPDAQRHDRVLLDSIELEDGRRIELLSWGRGCLRLIGIDGRNRECGIAPSERKPPVEAEITAEAIAQRSRSAPFEVYGTTSAEVTRVVVHYPSNGQRLQEQAHLLRGTDQTALDQAGISEPFGFFFAELPADTTAPAVQAVAFGRDGKRLGSTDFSAYRDLPVRVFIGGPSRP